MAAQPQAFVQSNDGQMHAASRFKSAPAPSRSLIVSQHYEGDKADAEEMLSLVADLERIKNKDVDILIYSRSDSGPFSPDVLAKLKLKFQNVTLMKCSRTDAKGWPFGSNGMFYDLVTMLGQSAKWYGEYFAFINLEPDCCPLCPGWFTKLTEEYKSRATSILGYIHDNPKRHVNGVAVYATDIWRRVPGGALGGGNPTIPFDLRHASNLLPLAQHTDLMRFQHRKPTITAEELYAPSADGTVPVLYHGVKDSSAREIVRAKHITFSSDRDFTRKTVFTFFNPENEHVADEEKLMLKYWTEGWRSRGWNPVVLRMQEAMRNGRYAAFVAAVDKFPRIGDAHDWMNRWLRYLALDTVGGGLFADLNVLPAQFGPNALNGVQGYVALGDEGSMFYADVDAARAIVTELMEYPLHDDDLLAGKPHVGDWTVIQRQIGDGVLRSEKWTELVGEPDFETFRAVRFTDAAINRKGRGKRRSTGMEEFLKNT